MRQAPPVSVLYRGRGWRGLQTAVPALAAAAFTAWCLQHADASDAAAALGAFAAGLVGGGVAWAAARHSGLTLGWDGERWTADGQPVEVQLMLDAAGGLLLRLRGLPGQRTVWLGVSAREAAAGWHGLRTALYASARRPEPLVQETPLPRAQANPTSARGH